MKQPTDLEYLHGFGIDEQIMMETQKIHAKYHIDDYNNQDFFIVLAEEFGEVASNMNFQQKQGLCDNQTKENLEYELIQVMTICKIWLQKLRTKEEF